MISKIYDEIRQTIKENYKFIITFFILMILFTIKFPFYIEAPGGIIDINDRIIIENKSESQGSFNLAFVTEIKATIPTLILAYFNDDWNIIKEEEILYENETYDDENYRSHLLLNEANNNAVIVAYTYADKEIIISNEHLFIIYVDENAETDLKIGDEILEIDGTKILNKNQLDEIVLQKNVGDRVSMLVKRDDDEIECFGVLREVDNKKIIGISLSKTSDVITNPQITFNFKSSESGPSGGLMMALSIYDALVDEDITRGMKIVGTGTIDSTGAVGSIGGIEYKIKGAVKENADIFLVPSGENYNDAKKLVDENEYDIQLIEVDSFEDALNKLSEITG